MLKEDISKISNLNFLNIRELVMLIIIFQKILKRKLNKVNFNITFDKDKIHNLFFKKGISYSDITDKEFFILPILLRKMKYLFFLIIFFMKTWNIVEKKMN